MEANILTGLLGKYNTLLLFHFLVVLSVIYFSASLPSLDLTPKNVSVKRKEIGKKLLWLFSSSFLITLIAFSLLYLNEVEAQRNSVKLNLVDYRLIEFPNLLEDMDRDLYIPFRCQFPEDKVRTKFFRYNRGKKENINRKIDAHKDPSFAAGISLTGDGEFVWIDGGSVDINIPISGNCIKDGKVKILIALFDGSSEKYTIPYEFETLAPVPEARNSWTIASRITNSEVKPGSIIRLFVDATNSGQEAPFEFILNVLDSDTRNPVPKQAYQITNLTNDTFTIQRGSRHQYEWVISFKKMGVYLLNTGVKKNIRYFDLPVNRENWADSYNYQNLFVTVTDGVIPNENLAAEDSDIIGSIVSPTEEIVAVYADFRPEIGSEEFVYSFETETLKSGADLYEEPSAESSVVATRIRKGARIIVFGKGNDASEIIANSDRYVKADVIKLNKTGYMKKQFLSAADTREY